MHPVLKQRPIFEGAYRPTRLMLSYRKIERHLISMIYPILWKDFHFITISIATLQFNYLLLRCEAFAYPLPILFPFPLHLQTLPRPSHSRNPLLKGLMPVHLWFEVRSTQKQIIILLIHSCQPTPARLNIFYLPQCSFPSVHGRLSSDNIIQRFNVSFGLI